MRISNADRMSDAGKLAKDALEKFEKIREARRKAEFGDDALLRNLPVARWENEIAGILRFISEGSAYAPNHVAPGIGHGWRLGEESAARRAAEKAELSA